VKSDAELVRETLNGERDAFGELVRRHQGSLYRFLVQSVGNVHDAEELTQDTFLRAYSRLHRYRETYALSTWLFAIARRLTISWFRRRRQTVPIAGDLPATGDAPDQLAARRDGADQVWREARAALPDQQFMAIWLRYQEDLSVRDVAHALGKTETHAKVILYRARSRLAKTMGRTDHVVLDRTMADIAVS
jgi:RNA polymerase sigma-70 factor (ECF subfamily)